MLTTSAARVCPRTGSGPSALLSQGLCWATANVVCNHKDVAAAALSCLDAVLGAHPPGVTLAQRLCARTVTLVD